MDDTYSTYDAKAKFSEILRRVREGQTVTISYHGKPVAEIRPIAAEGAEVDEQLSRLENRGVLVRSVGREGKLKPIVRKPGALKRFLRERDA